MILEEGTDIKGNKGEWSEFYTFLKLLAEGRIYAAADENLNKNDSLFYEILKIVRGNNEDFEYLRSNEIIIQDSNGKIISKIPIETIKKFSDQFYHGIAKGKTGERAFQLEFAKTAFKILYTNSLSDERKQTSDIRIVIHDPVTHHEPLLGFSIKSYIGGKPTLFNASKSSNIVYRISPEIDEETRIKLNSFDTYGKRITWLKENDYKLTFLKLNSEIFKTNLELIDSRFPEILSSLVLSCFLTRSNRLSDLTSNLTEINPLDFNTELNPNFYTYKIKRLLVDAALGMKAGTLWTGNFSANGGYIIVKKDGELVCYHIYNWNDFQTYLINQTKIDFPDSDISRCDYGRILSAAEVNETSGSFIKLNFQIRFR